MPEPSPSHTALYEQVGAEVLLDHADAGEAAAADVAETSPEATAAEGYQKHTLGIFFWIAVAWMVVLVLLAVLAPWLTSKGIIQDPNFIDLNRKFAKMSNRNRLGADDLAELARLSGEGERPV